jgi:hypothetical protein
MYKKGICFLMAFFNSSCVENYYFIEDDKNNATPKKEYKVNIPIVFYVPPMTNIDLLTLTNGVEYINGQFNFYNVNFKIEKIVEESNYPQKFMTDEYYDFYKFYDEDHGAIQIFISESIYDKDSNKFFAGWTSILGTNVNFCKRFVVIATNEPQIFGHEIGHAFGLPHDEEEDNLMYYAPQYNSYIDDRQGEIFLKKAIEYNINCVK